MPVTARKAVHLFLQVWYTLPLSALGASFPLAAASVSRKWYAFSDHLPPTSIPVTTSLQRVPLSSSGYRRSLSSRASCNATPSFSAALLRGSPVRFSGLTSVVSTASWLPRGGKPSTTHSTRLSSVGNTPPRLVSLSRPVLSSCPPASLQTRRHIFSSGTARVCSTPQLLHAALWSPKWSSFSPQLQCRGPSCSGKRSLLRSSARSCPGSHCVSFCKSSAVKCAPAQQPDCDRRRAW